MLRVASGRVTPAREPLEIDRPDVVAEVHAAFLAYEVALVDHDLAVLDDAFWDDPRVVRYGTADAQRGPREGHARVAGAEQERGTPVCRRPATSCCRNWFPITCGRRRSPCS